jgi:hypothetical protein
VRLDVVHELVKTKLAVEPHQFAETFKVEIEENTIAHLPPSLQVFLAAVEANTCSSPPLSPAVEGVVVLTGIVGLGHVYGERDGDV